MQFLLLNNLFGKNLAQAICWTLVHSLWQGLFFALCACIAILATRKSTALIRYNIITTLFFAFIAASAFTFVYEWKQAGSINDSLVVKGNSILTAILSSYQIPVYLEYISQYLSAYANYIVLIWLIILGIKSFQTIGAISYIYRIKTQKIQLPADEWKEKLAAFAAQLNITRKIELIESGLTRIPLVIGHFKPAIFIPIGLLTQIPADQVEAVLWHELAHIRRNDYLVNFLQHLAEAVFFFNPALLWISTIMRTERENCCDDIAISQTNNKKQFIEALISFKEYAINSPAFVPAFPGKKNQLLQRVSRIITHQNKTLHTTEKIMFLMGCALLFAFFSISTQSAHQKFTTIDQKLSVKNIALRADEQLSPIVIKEKSAPFQFKSKATIVRTHATHKISEKNIAEPIALKEMTINQAEKEILVPLTDHEKAEIDRKSALEDQQQAILDMEQAKKDKQQAQLDKLMAERDAQKANLDRYLAEQDMIRAKLDREKYYQRQLITKPKADQKSSQ